MAKTPEEFSIGIEIFAKLETLQASLQEAERKVEESARQMARKAKAAAEKAADEALIAASEARKQKIVEGVHAEREVMDPLYGDGGGGDFMANTAANAAGDKFARAFKKKLKRVLGAGAFIGFADMFLKAFREGVEQEKGWSGIGEHIALSITEGVTNLMAQAPVFGELMQLSGYFADYAMGASMEQERRQQASRVEAQQRLAAEHAAERRAQKEREGIEAYNRMIEGYQSRQKEMAIGRNMKAEAAFMAEQFEGFDEQEFADPQAVQDAALSLRSASADVLADLQQELRDLEALEKSRIDSNKEMGEVQKAWEKQLIHESFRERHDLLREEHEDRLKRIDQIEEREIERLEEQAALEAKQIEEALRQKQEGEARMRQLQMQADEMREAAALRAQQMTRTVGTAGGSFTFAVNAQVDEMKLMRDIVKQIPELMMVLINSVQRTGAMNLA